MAKGTANCRCATCGKEFTVEKVCYNRADATKWESWAEAHYDECDDCREKRLAEEREADNRKSAEAAAEKGWPELTGTEKQVAWATTIRENEVASLMKYRRESRKHPDSIQIFDACLEILLGEHTAASWWIDNRGSTYFVFVEILHAYRDNPESFAHAGQAKEAEEAAKNDEATIAVPQEKQHDGVVEITAADSRVSARYEKNDDFRVLVKGLGYRWDADRSCWYLSIGVKTGAAAERAAELGNKLLNAGFAIRIQNPETLRNAIEGKYEPMYRRWITRVPTEDTFIVSWAREDDLYSQAKRLPRARYRSPDMLVPGREYMAVLDFAETYGFRLSPGAEKLVAEMRGTTVTVVPAAAKNPAYDEHSVESVLDSSREVLDDLKETI